MAGFDASPGTDPAQAEVDLEVGMNPRQRESIADRVRAQLRRLFGGPVDVTSGSASPSPTPGVSQVGTKQEAGRTDDAKGRDSRVAPETATPQEDITANLGLIPDASAPEGATPVEELRSGAIADDAPVDERTADQPPPRPAPQRTDASDTGGNYGSGNLQTGSRGSLGIDSRDLAVDDTRAEPAAATIEVATPGDPAPAGEPAPGAAVFAGGDSLQSMPSERAGADLSRTGLYADVQADAPTTSTSTREDTGTGASRAGADLSRTGLYADIQPDVPETATDVPPAAAGATGDGIETGAVSHPRPGADLSRTGLYADIRGDEPAETVTAGEEAPAVGDMSHAGPEGTPIEQTLAPAATVGDAQGNVAVTSGDDYSAERSAEIRAEEPADSTTAAEIGQQMPSGSEFSSLVDREDDADLSDVTVEAGTEPRVETRGRYAGAVRGDGTANTPPGFPVKGNASSKIYHTPDMPSYRDTKPEWCFATAEDAVAAGFRPPKARNQRQPARDDASSEGQATEPTRSRRKADPA